MNKDALVCYECGTTTIVGGPFESNEECPACGEDNTVTATLTECPDLRTCRDDNHDYGLDRSTTRCHVVENTA